MTYAARAELLVWARKLPRACAHGWRLDAGGSPSLAESLESNQSNDIVYFNNNQIASSTDPGELSGAQSLYFNAVRAVVVLTRGAWLQGGQQMTRRRPLNATGKATAEALATSPRGGTLAMVVMVGGPR